MTVDVIGTNHINIGNKVFDITGSPISISEGSTTNTLDISKMNNIITVVGNENSGLIKDVKDNQDNISTLKTTVGDETSGLVKDVKSLQDTIGDSNNGLVKNVADIGQKTTAISYDANDKLTTIKDNINVTGTSTFNGEATFKDGIKVDKITDVAGNTSVTVADLNKTVNNTQKISYGADDRITSSKATKIDGITVAGGVRLADGKVVATGGSLILEGVVASGNPPSAELTYDRLSALTGLLVEEGINPAKRDANGKTIITAGDGSTIGRLKFNDNTIMSSDGESRAKIKVDYNKVTISVDGSSNPVVIDEKGLRVGTGTAHINNDGFSVGDATTSKNQLNSDGLKAVAIGVGENNTEFVVDKQGNVTAEGSLNVTGKTVFGDPNANNVTIESGNLTATGALSGKTLDISSGKVKITDQGIATFGTSDDDKSTINNGTITATKKLRINDQNYLDTDGLVANKAIIDNITVDGDKITSNAVGGALSIAGLTVNDNGDLSGVKSLDGVSVIANTGTSGGVTGGLSVGGNAIIGASNTPFSSNGFDVDKDGNVEGKSFEIKGSANHTKLEDGSLTIGTNNTWTNDNGINATSVTTGNLQVNTSAKFGSASTNQTEFNDKGVMTATGAAGRSSVNGKVTTIDGGIITTDTLNVKRIELGEKLINGATGGAIEINSNGSISAASDNFKVDADGSVTNKISGVDGSNTYNTNFTTGKDGIKLSYSDTVGGNNNYINTDQNGVTIGVEGNASTDIKGMIAARDNLASIGFGTENAIQVTENTITSILGADITRTMTNSTTEQSIVDKVKSASRTLKDSEIIDEAAGKTITTNTDGTRFNITGSTDNTLINGSKITSTNGTGTGVLDGSNLTLTKDAEHKTELIAGGVTFTGEAGEKGGKTTIINGGTITTDTLNVERINLGGEVIDKGAAGVEDNSKLYMDAKGNFRAASGKFKVNGADGAMTNTVGNTTLSTSTSGASMSYDGSVKSEVSVGADTAKVSAGAGSISVSNEEIKSAVGSNASSTINSDKIIDKVGNNSVTTDANGTTFDNGSGKTTINGDTITTGKLITDELVITGNGNADGTGSGSLAFGGNGTIKSDVKSSDPGDKRNTSFTTDIDGVTTSVTDGTAKSENKQTATSIGGVITNGTIKIAQTLDGANGTITNEVTDNDGNSSKLIQDGKQLEFTDSANADKATRITGGDVSIGSATDDSKRINLSDLGQIDDIDGELQGRDEYKNNSTAVGGLNAEAAIRREEVARLDNRIDDVNNRVDKVGAMAAAIASLKTMGYDPQAPSEFSVGLGQYKGETGVALGFFHYPNKNFMVNVSLSTAGGETMGGIGATWRFGHKSPQKLLQEQREAQAKKELAAAEKYRAAAQLAKEAQERAEYAAKLARQAQVSADNAKAAADATQAKHFSN